MTVTNRLENNERRDTSDFNLTDNGFVFEWRGACEAGDCEFREVAYTEEHAAWMVRSHPCPMQYHPPRRYNFLSIAEFYWIELDGVVDEIKSLPADADAVAKARLAGRASGLAYAITKACQPYYADETAVSRMANKRWKQRNGQEDWEPTPGFKYDPPIPGMAPGKQYKQLDAEPATYTRGKVERAISSLGTKKVGDIKRALEQGMFPAKDLARVYNVDVDVIEAIGKS